MGDRSLAQEAFNFLIIVAVAYVWAYYLLWVAKPKYVNDHVMQKVYDEMLHVGFSKLIVGNMKVSLYPCTAELAVPSQCEFPIMVMQPSSAQSTSEYINTIITKPGMLYEMAYPTNNDHTSRRVFSYILFLVMQATYDIHIVYEAAPPEVA
jgi:hypothetical protein